MNNPVKLDPKNSDEDGQTTVVCIILQDLFDIGRSTFIKILSSENRSFDVWHKNWWCGTRIDLGDEIALQLCFDGGNLRRSFWEQVLIPKINTLAGTILIVDGVKPETFNWIMTEIQHLQDESPVPFVVAIFSQTELGTLTLQSVLAALDIPPEIPVVPCVATDKESVKRVLVTLLDEVLKTMAMDKG